MSPIELVTNYLIPVAILIAILCVCFYDLGRKDGHQSATVKWIEQIEKMTPEDLEWIKTQIVVARSIK